MIRGPVEVCVEIGVQRWASAGETRVEEEVLHVDRDEFLRAAQFIVVRAACDLAVVLLPLPSPAYILRPAGQVEQAWVVAERKASLSLAATFLGQADFALAAHVPRALNDQLPFAALPQPRTVIDVRQLVEHCGEQFLAHSAMRASGFASSCAAVGEARQKLAIELKRGNQ
ncbi:hypothetical protein D3C77_497510 [compost metagenome]